MITKKNYITANFIDSDRKNIEILATQLKSCPFFAFALAMASSPA